MSACSDQNCNACPDVYACENENRGCYYDAESRFCSSTSIEGYFNITCMHFLNLRCSCSLFVMFSHFPPPKLIIGLSCSNHVHPSALYPLEA